MFFSLATWQTRCVEPRNHTEVVGGERHHQGLVFDCTALSTGSGQCRSPSPSTVSRAGLECGRCMNARDVQVELSLGAEDMEGGNDPRV